VQIIQNLFRFYLEDPERLPRGYAEQARQAPPYRVICDYIAGMTDSFIQRLHQELLGSGNASSVPAATEAGTLRTGPVGRGQPPV
jgi:hypothetical protein